VTNNNNRSEILLDKGCFFKFFGPRLDMDFSLEFFLEFGGWTWTEF